MRTARIRLATPLVLLAAFVLISGTQAQTPESEECGEWGAYICTETETCDRFLFFFKRNCSSEYTYTDSRELVGQGGEGELDGSPPPT